MRKLSARFVIAPCLLLLLTVLTGCSTQTLMKKFVSPQDDTFARNLVQLLRQKNYDAVKQSLDPSAIDDSTDDNLDKMQALLPPGDPVSIKPVGSHYNETINSGGTKRVSNLVLEYEFPNDRWALATVATVRYNGKIIVTNFNIQALNESLECVTRFDLFHAGLAQYIVLFLALVSTAVSIYTFALCCIHTRIAKRKWLWAILTLIGVCNFEVNWSTGETTFNLFYFHIPPAGFSTTFYRPWMIYVSLPLGAIIFLLFRRTIPEPPPPVDPYIYAPPIYVPPPPPPPVSPVTEPRDPDALNR